MATKESVQAQWLSEYRRCMEIARKFQAGTEVHTNLLGMLRGDSEANRDYIIWNAIYSQGMAAHYYGIARYIRERHFR